MSHRDQHPVAKSTSGGSESSRKWSLLSRGKAVPRHLSEHGVGLSRSLDHLDLRSRGYNKSHLPADSLQHAKDENVRLGRELAEGTQRIARLQKMGQEVDCLREQYEQLQVSAQKRERLGHAMRQKLEERLAKLEQVNSQLKEQYIQEKQQPGSTHMQAREEMVHHINKRDQLIESLQTQFSACKANIAELEDAVMRLQPNMPRMAMLQQRYESTAVHLKEVEQELHWHIEYNSRLPQLESEFLEMRSVDAERIEEHRLCMSHLEEEARVLYGELRVCALGGDDLLPIRLGLPDRQADVLKRLLTQREQRVQQLEEEVLRWQQLYLNELREAEAPPSRANILVSRFRRQESSAASQQQQIAKRRQDEVLLARRHLLTLQNGLKDLQAVLVEREIELRQRQAQLLQQPPTGNFCPSNLRTADWDGLGPGLTTEWDAVITDGETTLLADQFRFLEEQDQELREKFRRKGAQFDMLMRRFQEESQV